MAKKIREFKRCPRCDTKTVIYNDVCPACGLVYSRLINASNKEAKKAIRKGQKNRVICDKTLPSDVNKWKLFFLSLFFGMFGVPYYYVGKYKTGVVFTISTAMLLIAGALGMQYENVWRDYYFWMWLLILPAGGCLVALAIDWVKILTNSFRVPIALKEDNVVASVESINKDNTKEVLKIVEEVNKKVEKGHKDDKLEVQETAEEVKQDEVLAQKTENTMPKTKKSKKKDKK